MGDPPFSAVTTSQGSALKTSPITSADLRASVIAVPPMPRHADGAINPEANGRLLGHLRAGQVTTFMYGGNANFYNLGVAELGRVLDALTPLLADGDWLIPSVGRRLRQGRGAGRPAARARLPHGDGAAAALSGQPGRCGARLGQAGQPLRQARHRLRQGRGLHRQRRPRRAGAGRLGLRGEVRHRAARSAAGPGAGRPGRSAWGPTSSSAASASGR